MKTPDSLKELCLNVTLKEKLNLAKLPSDSKEQVLLRMTPEELCNEGCKDKEIAFFILAHESLYENLKFDIQYLGWLHEQSPKIQAVSDNIYKYGEGILRLGNSNKEVAQYICENKHLFNLLSNEQQEQLLNKANPPVRSYWPGSHGF